MSNVGLRYEDMSMFFLYILPEYPYELSLSGHLSEFLTERLTHVVKDSEFWVKP